MTTADVLTVNLTAPVIVDRLAEKVALVDQYNPDAARDWVITVDHGLPEGRWVLEWRTLTLTVGSYRDLELARFAASEEREARRDLRRRVVALALELGLPASRYYHPAPPGARR